LTAGVNDPGIDIVVSQACHQSVGRSAIPFSSLSRHDTGR
jgi:hypothetical protein